MKRVDRENQIFETLQKFKDLGLDFIVVGGYGVSAYQHRFSVDADLIVKEEQLKQFTGILEDLGFERVADKELDVYGGKYIAYEKDRELPVTIDLLVNSLTCRQTDASWNYQYFQEHSKVRKIKGSEKEVEVSVPEKELLMAVKLHSGRLTDIRDVVVLATNIDTDKVGKHLDRGNKKERLEMLEKVEEVIEGENFEDSFKGVFQQKEKPENKIQTVEQIVETNTRK